MKLSRPWVLFALVVASLEIVQATEPADGLISGWTFTSRQCSGGSVPDVAGKLPLKLAAGRQFIPDGKGDSLLFEGRNDPLVILPDISSAKDTLPVREMTVSVWVAVDQPQDWGGIICALQDNGDAESGWGLGFNRKVFTFALAGKGADDGNGRMTYLGGKTQYQQGRWYHVVGTYDGKTMRLFVNGKLDATSDTQSGDILYPSSALYVLGGYRDSDESHPFGGRIREVSVFRSAIDGAEIARVYEPQAALTELPSWLEEARRFVVQPYLQFVTPTSITVCWETEEPATSRVDYGTSLPLASSAESSEATVIHQIELKELRPNTAYLYRVSGTAASGKYLRSSMASFQTAVEAEAAYGFVVIGDTQSTPESLRRVAELSFAERPHFAVIAGDLVSSGRRKGDWTGHFFPNMSPLISRVAFFPTIGNHEEDAEWYYKYMALPSPEYHYSFCYGNSEFFMIDSNRPVQPGSEQHAWLDKRLGSSRAKWKFVVHHHPPYSSDSDDYGDTSIESSTQGDPNMRNLVPLYEKYRVDIVWSGHIHLYERTWPIREGRVVDEGGVMYVITGGGGGGLEQFAPTRSWFTNKVHRQHHYCYITIRNNLLQFQAIDENGRLFDSFTLEKRGSRPGAALSARAE